MTVRRISRAPKLNYRLIVPVVAGTLLVVALGMLVCDAVAVVYDDGDAATLAFGLTGAVLLPLSMAGIVYASRFPERPMRTRDGFLAVTLAWVVASIAGAVPFLIAGTFDRPVYAFFESMSGFTTTGATVLNDIEAEPASILLWRSIMQWLGGVGIVVLVVAIAPATGMASQRVFYAETSGVTSDRLTPRIADTAKIIWGIYLVLTGLALTGYALAGMGLFDAVNHSMTTVATGGYSTRTASIAAFDSLGVELVAIVFMLAGGINFAFYWQVLRNRRAALPQLPEIKAFGSIVVVAIAAITASLLLAGEESNVGSAVRVSAFAVSSIITSTGYITEDFDEWTTFAGMVLLALMFVGGCAGSTAGGMKVIRIMLLGKAAVQEVQRQLRPTAVQVLRVRGRVYGEDVRRGVLGFFYIYMTVFLAGVLVMSAFGLDAVTSAASVIATLNIIGPGIGDIGAAESYSTVPEGGLWVLSLLMLIGRLEVFTVLVLLVPAFWRRNIA